MILTLINKLILGLCLLPLIILTWLALSLTSSPDLLFTPILILTIASLLSLIYLTIKSITNSKIINPLAIKLSHLGMLITAYGVLALMFSGEQSTYATTPPHSMFSFGLVAVIPYLYLMLSNDFFEAQKNKHKNLDTL